MNKVLQLPVEIKLVEGGGQIELVLEFSRDALRDWCLGLCLLSDRLIEQLIITGTLPRTKVTFRRYRESEATVSRLSYRQDASVVEISENDTGYLRAFFLKYYRDGLAEVDHIHLEVLDSRTNSRTADITFKVPDAKPPASPEEMRRLLGE